MTVCYALAQMRVHLSFLRGVMLWAMVVAAVAQTLQVSTTLAIGNLNPCTQSCPRGKT